MSAAVVLNSSDVATLRAVSSRRVSVVGGLKDISSVILSGFEGGDADGASVSQGPESFRDDRGRGHEGYISDTASETSSTLSSSRMLGFQAASTVYVNVVNAVKRMKEGKRTHGIARALSSRVEAPGACVCACVALTVMLPRM